ncbi:MAG: terminase small subunit [Oscillospiraceae bacterium]|nr:terminase small subunit [Oscillospiraceae bacterium]
MALTEKQARFVAEYLVDLNATQAAIRAGYSEKTAEAIGYENLRKPQIAEAIDRAIQDRQKRTEITQDMVLRELARVAFANGTDFAQVVSREAPTTVIDEDGCPQQVMSVVQSVVLRDTRDVDPEKRAAIAGIKEGKFGIEVKSYDKVKALELLGQHLGLFDSRASQNPNRENNLLSRLMDGTEEELNTDDLPEVQ